jgi:outer membrane protein insertion porin family
MFSVQYTQRWVFGLPLSASFDFTVQHMRRRAAMANFNHFFHGDEDRAFPAPFDSWEQFEAANRIPPKEFLMPYNQWRLSVGVGTGYRWITPVGNLSVGGGYRVGITLNSFENRYRPFDPLLRERQGQWTPAMSIWTNIALDQRDIFFDPSRGYYIAQRVGLFGFLDVEQERFIRTDTRAQWFHTLFDLPVTDNWNFRAVLGIHTGLSFIFPQPGRDLAVEEANRLSVDGMFVGRGWTGEFRRRGLALWDNWVEIRIPLAPGILAWDFFFDAAGVKPTPDDLFNNFGRDDGSHVDYGTFFMRFSMGGGLRFTIPQFPLRFSLAQRFLIRDGRVEWQNGAIGGGDRWGLDFVVSFALTTF